jgi:hypothetical protein
MKYGKWIILILSGGATIYSCNKSNLSQPALGSLDETKLANKKGVEGLLIGAYSMLDGIGTNPLAFGASGSNWIYGSICGSEAYKGSSLKDQEDIGAIENFKATATNEDLSEKWLAVYTGVQRTNTLLRILNKATGIEKADSVQIAAEARFLRGHYHFEAIKIWNKVPYVDETITYESDNFHLGNDSLIWPQIENDLKFATNNLPDKMQAVGRANHYAAEAFLAKVYMFQQKYDSVKPLLEDLITNGVTANNTPYALEKYYEDNFNPATKNSAESIFAVQNSVNDGSGLNGNLGDRLNYPSSADGPGEGCCGFFQPSQYLVNHFKTDLSTGLPDLDNFNANDVKTDTGYASNDSSFIPYDGTLDPRLDWTVGRRGIPYLDWGIHPGSNSDWIRDQQNGGPYSPIKNVYYKRDQGRLSDASFWATSTSTNINLIRFADIILWAAETEIEVGSLQKATDYVNQVRRRMEDPSGWVHTYIDPSNPQAGFTLIPAANYKIGEYPTFTTKEYARKAVRYERMLELGMEGHRFFDLVRWGIADTEINAYILKEKNSRTYLNNARFQKGKNECFPIPQTQIDLSAGPDGKQLLIQNPGY